MTPTQAEASRFFLNEDLWLEDCQCSLDTSSLVIAKGEKSFTLTLNNIAFTGYRAKTEDKPAAVVLCQASGESSEDDERPEPFDDLLIEFPSTEIAMSFHKALESAVSDATAIEDIDMAAMSSSSSSENDDHDDEIDLPSRMMQESSAEAAQAQNAAPPVHNENTTTTTTTTTMLR